MDKGCQSENDSVKQNELIDQWTMLQVHIIHVHVQTCTQSNLSIQDTLGPKETALIIEVSLFHRFIYTHLYCNGTTTDCPYYRGVLISECPQ